MYVHCAENRAYKASVKRVTDIMGEITAATEEQTSGIEQVNVAITQIDSVTQQNAALVEEAAAAAQSMQEQSRHLLEAVSVFKVEAGQGSGGPQVQAALLDVTSQRSQVMRKAAPGTRQSPGTGKLVTLLATPGKVQISKRS